MYVYAMASTVQRVRLLLLSARLEMRDRMGSCFSVADRSGRKERKGESETEVWKLGSRLSLLRVLL